MQEPHVFKAEPTAVMLEEGKTYAWCTCGLSQKNPFCDGHHKTIEGMPFKPLRFTAEKSEEVWLCNCKHTKTPPFCDGTHEQFRK